MSSLTKKAWSATYLPGGFGFPGGGYYGSTIWASSLEEAQEISKQRAIGERLDGNSYTDDSPLRKERQLPSDLFKAGKYTAALHFTTFLSFIGLKSGLVTPEETVGDTGVIHELIHFMETWKRAKKQPSSEYLQHIIELERKNVIDILLQFEKKIPGLPP